TDGKQARPQRSELGRTDAATLWATLASADARAADRAAWALVVDSEPALAFLGERLRPLQAPDDRRLAALLADLDSEQFAVREKALHALEQYEGAVKLALVKALKKPVSAEVRRRIESLLANADRPESSPEMLRVLRAVR